MRFPSILPVGFRNQAVNITPIKVGTGSAMLLAWRLINQNVGQVYLKLYDSIAAPVIGTAVPVAIIPIFAGGVSETGLKSSLNAGFVPHEFFQNFMWIAATTGILDTDSTAPSVNIDVQLKYVQ